MDKRRLNDPNLAQRWAVAQDNEQILKKMSEQFRELQEQVDRQVTETETLKLRIKTLEIVKI